MSCLLTEKATPMPIKQNSFRVKFWKKCINIFFVELSAH